MLNKIEGCDRFLTILTMIAGMFRVSCNNDSRVYNQSLIGKKGPALLITKKIRESGENRAYKHSRSTDFNWKEK